MGRADEKNNVDPPHQKRGGRKRKNDEANIDECSSGQSSLAITPQRTDPNTPMNRSLNASLGDSVIYVSTTPSSSSDTAASINGTSSTLSTESDEILVTTKPTPRLTGIKNDLFDWVRWQEDHRNFILQCKICKSSIKGNNTGTGNFSLHYSNRHGEYYAKYCEQQNTMTPAAKKARRGETLQHSVCKAALDLIVNAHLPFNIVTRDEFKNLLTVVNPQIEQYLPSASSVYRCLYMQFSIIRSNLKNLITQLKYISTTIDIWSAHGRSFIGMILTFIDETTLERKKFVVAFVRLKQKQEYSYLSQVINCVHYNLGMKLDQLTHCMTDGGSNLAKVFRRYGVGVREHSENCQTSTDARDDDDVFNQDTVATSHLDQAELERYRKSLERLETEPVMSNCYLDGHELIEHYEITFPDFLDDMASKAGSTVPIILPPQMRCYAHLLNLIGANDFLTRLQLSNVSSFKAFDEVQQKLKRFWYFIRKSALARQIIENLFEKQFPVPNDTRWNSKYRAFKCIVDRYQSYCSCFERIKSDCQPEDFRKVSREELVILSDYVLCMAPISIALDILQGDDSSVGFVLPVLMSTKCKIESAKVASAYGNAMKKTMLEVFDARFNKILEPTIDNKEIILATLTHPKFKIKPFPISWHENCQKMFVEEYIKMEAIVKAQTPNIAENVEHDDHADDCIDEPDEDFFACIMNSRDSNVDETLTASAAIMQYFQENSKDFKIFENERFGIIRRMYLRFNTTLSSGGCIERMFSQAVLLYTSKRNRMDPQTMEKALFLKYNAELYSSTSD